MEYFDRERIASKPAEERITLGIESSCDETAAAVLRGGRELLADVISTQVPIHRKFGGVVPEIASRNHILNVLPVVDEAVKQAGLKLADIDQIAVTYGPGLVGALLVGVAAAKSLAWSLEVPLIGVNHLEGHIFANFLSFPDLTPPFVALVASGGIRSWFTFQTMTASACWARREMTRPGRPLTRWRGLWGCPIPAGRKLTGWPERVIPRQSTSPGRWPGMATSSASAG